MLDLLLYFRVFCRNNYTKTLLLDCVIYNGFNFFTKVITSFTTCVYFNALKLTISAEMIPIITLIKINPDGITSMFFLVCVCKTVRE